MAQTYQYKGPFSIEDGEKPDTYQQWFNGKIYDEKEIVISSKRLDTLINLGYLKPIENKNITVKGKGATHIDKRLG